MKFNKLIKIGGKNNKRLKFLALGSFIFIVLIIWLPSGFNRTGLEEPWGMHGQWSSGALPKPHIGDQFRPFLPYLSYLTYLLSPDSHHGWHALFILIFLLKAICCYELMKKLAPQDYAFSYIVSILFFIYPSSNELFAFRAIQAHLVTLLYIFSVLLLVSYWESEKYYFLICIWITQILCLGLYESPFPLIFVTPILLVIIQGGISKKVLISSFFWLIIPVGWFLFFLPHSFLSETQTYENRASINFTKYPLYKIKSFVYGYLLLFWRNFFSVWLLALGKIQKDFMLSFYSILGASVVSLVTLKHLLSLKTDTKSDNRTFKYIFFIGLLIMVFGFAAFAISQYRYEASRTYLLSSFGAAISMSALIRIISLGRKFEILIFVAGAFIFTTLALISDMHQHKHYAERSTYQQKVLAGVIDIAPKIVGDNITLVLTGLSPKIFHSSYLHSALVYLYNEYPPRLTDVQVYENTKECIFDDEGLIFVRRDSNKKLYEKRISYDKLILIEKRNWSFSIIKNLEIPFHGKINYNPLKLIMLDASIPPKAYSMLSTMENN